MCAAFEEAAPCDRLHLKRVWLFWSELVDVCDQRFRWVVILEGLLLVTFVGAEAA